jgi:hypothetical protein
MGGPGFHRLCAHYWLETCSFRSSQFHIALSPYFWDLFSIVLFDSTNQTPFSPRDIDPGQFVMCHATIDQKQLSRDKKQIVTRQKNNCHVTKKQLSRDKKNGLSRDKKRLAHDEKKIGT